jgi:hypothetical protein
MSVLQGVVRHCSVSFTYVPAIMAENYYLYITTPPPGFYRLEIHSLMVGIFDPA